MLRLKVWPNGEYNTHDYGTVTNAAEFAWLNAYSPVQHVRTGAASPNLVTGGQGGKQLDGCLVLRTSRSVSQTPS